MARRESCRNKVVEGAVGKSHRCGDFIIISVDKLDITVRFINTGNIDVFRRDHVTEGSIKDQKAPLTFGVGYTDGVSTRQVGVKHHLYYRYWKQILERGYCPKLKGKYPSYKDVMVCDEWHSLKNFKSWFDKNYQEGWDNYCLDKDIICDQQGSKIYSPETCIFLPHRLNTLVIKRYTNRVGKSLPIGVTKKSASDKYCSRCQIGESQPHVIGYFDNEDDAWEAYRDFKQMYISELAKEYFDKNLIDSKAYTALLNYKVIREYQ